MARSRGASVQRKARGRRARTVNNIKEELAIEKGRAKALRNRYDVANQERAQLLSHVKMLRKAVDGMLDFALSNRGDPKNEFVTCQTHGYDTKVGAFIIPAVIGRAKRALKITAPKPKQEVDQ